MLVPIKECPNQISAEYPISPPFARSFKRNTLCFYGGAVDGLNLLTFLYFLNRIQQIWPTPRKADAGLDGSRYFVPWPLSLWSRKRFVGGVL